MTSNAWVQYGWERHAYVSCHSVCAATFAPLSSALIQPALAASDMTSAPVMKIDQPPRKIVLRHGPMKKFNVAWFTRYRIRLCSSR